MKRIRHIVILLSAVLLLLTACSDNSIIGAGNNKFFEIVRSESEQAAIDTTMSTPTKNNTGKPVKTTAGDTKVSVESSTHADTTAEITDEKEVVVTVYITPSGKRYHLDPDCGGKNSYQVAIDDVGGRTPCKKCAGG